MKYRIAVCDDNEADTAYLSESVKQWASERNCFLQIDAFSSAENFLFHYEGQKDFDILLLDIEMGRMDGVTLAKRLRRDNRMMQIIFVTGYSDYIAEGYEVSALHYLVKPVQREKLFTVLDRALEKLGEGERYMLFSSSQETFRIPLHEIRYAEVFHNYVTIHGKGEYTFKKTLSELEKELGAGFFRLGRSYIVNLGYIRKVTRTEVFLTDGTVLPLPRGSYEKLNRAIILA